MLILSRRPNETLVIGENIRVTILGIHGNQVRLGIAAPKNIVVDREEVHHRKQAEYRVPAEHAGSTRPAEAAADAAS
jgi:carbon storage regulator